jgi:hypothetical protein
VGEFFLGEFAQGMAVGALLVGGVVALGWFMRR